MDGLGAVRRNRLVKKCILVAERVGIILFLRKVSEQVQVARRESIKR